MRKYYAKKPTKKQKELTKQKIALAFFIAFMVVFGSYLMAEASRVPEVSRSMVQIKKTPVKAVKKEVVSESIREVTAYNVGDPLQCDDTPCISANGENICKALALGYKRCATNAFPFGTKLLIDGYGECLVVDRMNSRYKNRIDVALESHEKQRAIDWGLQRLKVQVIAR
jgi:3D (Asp-Asp-Asp) domain-containing protein